MQFVLQRVDKEKVLMLLDNAMEAENVGTKNYLVLEGPAKYHGSRATSTSDTGLYVVLYAHLDEGDDGAEHAPSDTRAKRTNIPHDEVDLFLGRN